MDRGYDRYTLIAAPPEVLRELAGLPGAVASSPAAAAPFKLRERVYCPDNPPRAKGHVRKDLANQSGEVTKITAPNEQEHRHRIGVRWEGQKELVEHFDTELKSAD